jgi:hypothetical protein
MENRGVEAKDEIDRGSASEPSGAAIRMLRAISCAASATGMPTQELDAAAKALVTELRLANHPPEQVLIQIKQILAEAGLKPSHGPADSTHVIGRHVGLYRSVIESSIRHYFAPEDGTAPTSA